MIITAFYGGLLAILFMVLTVRVIGSRRSAKVALGDGGDRHVLRRMRVHANFAEYVPLALILMACLESLQISAYLLHLLGFVLLVGRVLHAYGVSCERENLSLRVAGMAATLTVIGIGALVCIFIALNGGVFAKIF